MESGECQVCMGECQVCIRHLVPHSRAYGGRSGPDVAIHQEMYRGLQNGGDGSVENQEDSNVKQVEEGVDATPNPD